ncbi:hypothetical protein AVEN_230323-1 [Araneus ventricosus]|uniref:Uncharacterized protein n=1 Tax=Araneus ventricosus TaxID=182803 RepID=A0A4Y2WVE1_ARAVE|nr:hypothetical protein AVEN_230323-1 [Araneus ventricosus]
MSRNAVSPRSVAQGREMGGICCYIPFSLLLLILLKLDIHEASAPIHLDRFAKDGSNFQLIHIVGSFTKAPKRTTGRCDPRLLLRPSFPTGGFRFCERGVLVLVRGAPNSWNSVLVNVPF